MFCRTLHTYLKSFSSLWTKIVTLIMVSIRIRFCLWTIFWSRTQDHLPVTWDNLVKNIEKNPSSDGVGTFIEFNM